MYKTDYALLVTEYIEMGMSIEEARKTAMAMLFPRDSEEESE